MFGSRDHGSTSPRDHETTSYQIQGRGQTIRFSGPRDHGTTGPQSTNSGPVSEYSVRRDHGTHGTTIYQIRSWRQNTRLEGTVGPWDHGTTIYQIRGPGPALNTRLEGTTGPQGHGATGPRSTKSGAGVRILGLKRARGPLQRKAVTKAEEILYATQFIFTIDLTVRGFAGIIFNLIG